MISVKPRTWMQGQKCFLPFPAWLSSTHPVVIRQIVLVVRIRWSSLGCYGADLIQRSHCWVWSWGNPGNWQQNNCLCSILRNFTIFQHLKESDRRQTICLSLLKEWEAVVRCWSMSEFLGIMLTFPWTQSRTLEFLLGAPTCLILRRTKQCLATFTKMRTNC